MKKQLDRDAGEITQRTYEDYKKNCELLNSLAGDWCLEEMQAEHWAKLRADLCNGVNTTTAANRIRMARVSPTILG